MRYASIQKYQLKMNIKSLVAESRLLRAECRSNRVRDSDLRGSLHFHRVYHVRNALRVALLAYAAIRGVPYKVVERNAKSQPDWRSIKIKAKRFGANEDRIDRWIDEAKGAASVAA